jgi:hypothetical protein
MHGQNHFKFKLEGFDEVSGFTITNCAVTATSALTRIFYLSLSLQHFQHRGSKLPLLLSSRKATVPLSEITELYLILLIIF